MSIGVQVEGQRRKCRPKMMMNREGSEECMMVCFDQKWCALLFKVDCWHILDHH